MEKRSAGKKFGGNPVRERGGDTDKGYYTDHACEEVFTCAVCGMEVHPEGAASDHRNHCPNCLSSVHLDITPGDRASDCKGIMEPVSEWAVIHRCKSCGTLSSNRIAADDSAVKLMSIAMRPIANPPFPIERMKEITERLNT